MRPNFCVKLMDKNTIWGFVLIAAILIGFSFFNRPSKEQLAEQQRYRDSIAYAEQLKVEAEAMAREAQALFEQQQAAAEAANTELVNQRLNAMYGTFAPAAMGEEQFTVLDNDLVRLLVSNKGGRIYQAELKEYKAWGDTINNLTLFSGDEANLNFLLVTANNRVLKTSDLYFTAQGIQTDANGNQTLTMRLCTTDSASFIDFTYTLPAADYMATMQIHANQMQHILAHNVNALEMQWNQKIRQQEQGRKFENQYATLQYMFLGDDTETLSQTDDDSEEISSRLRWIAYKDQFFSTVMIADDAFTSTQLTSTMMRAPYIKEYNTITSVAFDPTGKEATNFRLYFGPNHYNTLKAYDTDVEKDDRLYLQELVPLGWKGVSWIDKILVIPMFDIFSSLGIHIGWIIILMTLVIKLIIFPFTWMSYKSTSKMRVLKPQIEAINAKIPQEKMQERQQATMALYSKYGVSPMSGCLPMLLQMPFLVAMFWFFPTAIELRGQSLFWAQDLSTYDAVLTWNANIPIISWLFGNHLSLFCLLMTLTNIAYTYFNMQNQQSGQEMKAMKWMMYLMPVMFLFIFNDYAAGLSYYYLVSMLFTIIQTLIMRWTTNDAKLLKQMEAAIAKKGKNPKKSGLMARLEQMQREQQAYAREQAKKRSPR